MNPLPSSECVNPIKKLREFVASHTALYEFATQRGFSKLIGRSEQYVKSLECSPKINEKLARQIEVMTGASRYWLLSEERWGDQIPGTDGKPLTHEVILKRLVAEKYRPPAPSVWINVNDPPEVALQNLTITSPVDNLLSSWRTFLYKRSAMNDGRYYIKLLEDLAKAEAEVEAEGRLKRKR